MKPTPRKYKYLWRYVIALVAVVILAAAALITTLYKSQHAENAALERIASYHLASAAALEQLNRSTQSLSRLLNPDLIAARTAADGGPAIAVPLRGTSGTLFSIRADIIRLHKLQEQYAGDQFVSSLNRLINRFDAVELSLAGPEPAETMLALIKVFELNVEQLYRLHQIAAADSLAGIQAQATGVLPNLGVLAAILIVAITVGGFIASWLRKSLVQQTAAEQALAASQKRVHQMQKIDALGQLVGGVAHDFNNLLTVILGQAGLLKEQFSGDKDIERGLDEISQSAQQAAFLTKQLLTFSRRQPIQAQVVDLNESIRDIEPMVRRLIDEDIELIFDYGDLGYAVELDPGQLSQVIVNLFINARDAIAHSGRIELKTQPVHIGPVDEKFGQIARGHYAKLVVTDNGVGMDDQTQERVFEPFFTTKNRGRGTGLGLATVHGIVTAASGQIFVESSPDRGTSIEIYLPGSDRQPTAAGADSAPAQSGSETVLVVEDEQQIRQLLQDGLGSLGYRVLTASGGPEGLDICRKETAGIDVIISDVVMPDMNGADFMKDAMTMQAGVVGIFISGYTDDIVLQRGVDGSTIPLVNKPFKLEEIAMLIRQQLEQKVSLPGRRNRVSAISNA